MRIDRVITILLLVWMATVAMVMVGLNSQADPVSLRTMFDEFHQAFIHDITAKENNIDDDIVLKESTTGVGIENAEPSEALSTRGVRTLLKSTGRRSELERSAILRKLVDDAKRQAETNTYNTVTQIQDHDPDEDLSEAQTETEIVVEQNSSSASMPVISGRPRVMTLTSKYLLYAPSGQLNNQRYCLMDAIAFANALNRTLVLPYLYFRHNYLARTSNIDGHDTVTITYSRLGNYFDLDALSNVVSYVDPTREELLEFCSHKLNVHQVGFYESVPSRYYRRLGFRITDLVQHHNWRPKWSFQEVIAGLGISRDACLSLGFIFERFDFSDQQGTELYTRARKSVLWNSRLAEAGERVRRDLGLPTRYLGVHLRRHNPSTCAKKGNDNHCLIPIWYAITTIKNLMKTKKLDSIYLATSILDEQELASLIQGLKPYRVYMYKRVLDISVKEDGNLISMIDQYLCAHATDFLGSAWSTFSTVIHEERTYVLEKNWGRDF